MIKPFVNGVQLVCLKFRCESSENSGNETIFETHQFVSMCVCLHLVKALKDILLKNDKRRNNERSIESAIERI